MKAERLFDVPIVFFIFNRPDTTREVFARIKSIKPKKLYIFADAPRRNVLEDEVRCAETRAIINVDWPCELFFEVADQNFGCKERIISGLDSVFKNEEYAVILEDDCVPNLDFFPFVRELLERYFDDERIMVISGNNFQCEDQEKYKNSYYFSKQVHLWGWATWRRVWEKYDVLIPEWKEVKEGGFLNNILPTVYEKVRFSRIFDAMSKPDSDTWDFQFLFNIWCNSGLSVVPLVNLVSNIGFNNNPTHVGLSKDSVFSNVKTEGIHFPLHHPTLIMQDIVRDEKEFKLFRKDAGLKYRVGYPLLYFLSKIQHG